MATNLERYHEAYRLMKEAVYFHMNNVDGAETTPAQLRCGVNSAMVEHSALSRLLIEKGIITREEYEAALADAMKVELSRYQGMIERHTGQKPNPK